MHCRVTQRLMHALSARCGKADTSGQEPPPALRAACFLCQHARISLLSCITLTICNKLQRGSCLQVDERFFATLMALNNQLDDIYPHATLHYEDWTRQTWGGVFYFGSQDPCSVVFVL